MNTSDDKWITESAVVLSSEGQVLWVAADKSSACGSCKAKSGCGTSLLAKLGDNQVVVRALLAEGLRSEVFCEGDLVELAIDRSALVKVALIMYLLPLMGLVLGVLSTQTMGEAWVVCAALLGLGLGGWAASILLRRWRNDEGLQPIVLRRSLAAGYVPLAFEASTAP